MDSKFPYYPFLFYTFARQKKNTPSTSFFGEKHISFKAPLLLFE